MSRLIWDAVGEKFYEMGTKLGVLYPMNNTGAYDKGVAWNGLTAVTESPSGAEETKLYADDIKYASLRSAEEYGYTIEAYTYPTEWEPCDGSAQVATGASIGQQKRQGFGFSWVTRWARRSTLRGTAPLLPARRATPPSTTTPMPSPSAGSAPPPP